MAEYRLMLTVDGEYSGDEAALRCMERFQAELFGSGDGAFPEHYGAQLELYRIEGHEFQRLDVCHFDRTEGDRHDG